MSTIYNPLAGDSFLTEFSGKPVTDNSIAPEAAPSSLVGGLGSLSDNFPVIPGLESLGGRTGSGSSLGGILAPNLSISRIVAIVLGLLLIGGGIIMFRPETIDDVRSAATAAAA